MKLSSPGRSQLMMIAWILGGDGLSATDSRVLRDAITRPDGLRVPTAERIFTVRIMSRFEDEGSSTLRRRGAPKEKFSSRRIWSVKEEEALANGLKSGGNIRAKPHINSKIHVWKKQYGTLVSMMSKSGLGWDDGKNMITVEENSISDDYVKVDPSVKSMRYKPFPYFPAWREIFGKDRASGDRAKDGKATAETIRTEEATETQDYYVQL
ncbi:UNVERIFIED_CONTAM: hypothetical protein Slati_2121500 [Sesamum latifolium]|uniref:Myb/SANT-like domain-containing protein n=1 Tax=Sesamum latifolium TaxID=2727402 RepID=A0AAW2WRF8_9LAMI